MNIAGAMPRRSVIRLAGVAAVCGALSSCERKTLVTDTQSPSQLVPELDAVRRVRFYFGHQSVGRNILDGVARISGGAGSPLTMVSAASIPSSAAWFAESEIGRNGEPSSKCDAFRDQVEKLDGRVDLAMMKLCFVDFDARTNPDDVFRKYADTVDGLRRRFPGLVVVHATAPLKVASSGIRRVIKDALGRTDESRAANLQRSRYNELLHARYRGEPIFDLAAVESTGPGGDRAAFTVDGRTGYSLSPAYASDSGHLNEAGGDRAARELIRTLAAALRMQTRSSRL